MGNMNAMSKPAERICAICGRGLAWDNEDAWRLAEWQEGPGTWNFFDFVAPLWVQHQPMEPLLEMVLATRDVSSPPVRRSEANFTVRNADGS